MESPHGDLTVVGHEQVLLIICCAHRYEGFGVQFIACAAPHERFSGHAAVPVHQPVAGAVQVVRIACHFLAIPQVHIAVWIAVGVIGAEPGSVGTALHVPVPGSVLEGKHTVVDSDCERGLAVLCRKGEAVIASVVDILLGNAVRRKAVSIDLVAASLYLLKVILGRAVDRTCFMIGLGLFNSGSFAVRN